MILSSAITAMVGYAKRPTMTMPSALPEELHARLAKATKEITPDRALAVAIKSLADAKVELFDRYKIEMYPLKENELSWRICFVALPEAPGMQVYVTVANDSRISIFLGSK